MKTNGSLSGHNQVDRHTIETALDDEVFSGGNEATNKAKGKRGKAKTGEQDDLLDILDNFLITTSSNAESSSEQQQFSSHPRSESITNVSSPAHQQRTLPTRFVKKGNKIGVPLNWISKFRGLL